MEIRFCGAARQVGRSQLEVSTTEARLLLDSGASTFKQDKFPLEPAGKIHGIILSHCHLDHSGFIPHQYKHHAMPWYATAPTQPLSSLLWQDAIKVAQQRGEAPYIAEKDIRKAERHFIALPYGEENELFDGTVFSLHDAGHITGSAQILLREGGKSLLYTGDFNYAQSRMHSAAVVPEKNVDALAIESTYADREHPQRKQVEKELAEEAEKALEDGNVLIPCFAVGRTQEILMALNAMQVDAKYYVDGMGIQTSALLTEYPSYCRDPKALDAALDRSHFVHNGSDRKKIAGGKGKVIIATAGMLDGGPALSYLQRINAGGNGAVFLTGFQAKDTNGRSLLEKGEITDRGRKVKINLPVKLFDFSAHSGRSELHKFVAKVNPGKVFCVHGDNCELFARELREKGFDAKAPELGQEFGV